MYRSIYIVLPITFLHVRFIFQSDPFLAVYIFEMKQKKNKERKEKSFEYEKPLKAYPRVCLYTNCCIVFIIIIYIKMANF